jgi:hypothetical protein
VVLNVAIEENRVGSYSYGAPAGIGGRHKSLLDLCALLALIIVAG